MALINRLKGIELSGEDHEVIYLYKKQFEKERGYTGPVFINVNRLAEIHMATSEFIVRCALYKAMNGVK